MIHKTAIIDPKAKISTNVSIGAYTLIGPNVEIGENSIIQSHVSIVGHTKIGNNNKIYSFASIGNDPQDLKFNGEETKLEIGNNVEIAGGSGVIKSIPDNSKVMGYPAKNIRDFLKDNK